MKVKVIREMPFAKVGNIFDTIKGKWQIINLVDVEQMIRDGWLEEVKEESLEDALTPIIKDMLEKNYLHGGPGWVKDLACKAKEFFNKYPEKLKEGV